jgi:hypothetical protein
MSSSAVICPRCSARLRVPRKRLNQSLVCPQCSNWFVARPRKQLPRARARMSGSTRRKVFGIAFACACVAALVFSLLYWLRTGQAGIPDSQLPAPDESLTVVEMAVQYRVNEQEAEQRFNGKVLQVIGRVDSVRKDLAGVPYVSLSESDGGEVFTVRCLFASGDSGVLENLHVGDTVTIDGRCRGRATVVVLEECKLQ